MKLNELESLVNSHSGEFSCEEIRGKRQKTVRFSHITTPPVDANVPDLGRLRDFYETFGSIEFYADLRSGDSARVIAPVSEWADLNEGFRGWFEDMAEDEFEECAPAWIQTCLVIGETPHSGNYILVPTAGDEAGRVFEFDHDGFEFDEVAADVVEYVKGMLEPDARRLTDFASHMRFIEADSPGQWWIQQLHDSRGRTVSTQE
jgi:hypothetical protein